MQAPPDTALDSLTETADRSTPVRALVALQRLAAAPAASPAPIQRLLDTGNSFDIFKTEIRGRNPKQNKDLDTALRQLYTAAKDAKVTIPYDWLVGQAKQAGNSAKAVRGLISGLEERAASMRDSDLSGDRGHMMGRHLTVDREFQEDRLRRTPNLDQVTRLDPRTYEVQKYQNYVDHLRKHVLDDIRQIMKDTAKTVGNRMEDEEFQALTNNGARQTYLREFVGSLDNTVDTDVYMLDVTITLRVTNNPAVIGLKWEPSVESVDTFSKIITARDPKEEHSADKYIEYDAHETVTMYWGSNAPALEGIALGTSADTLQGLVQSLDLPMGVTQF
ncbi:hypothetical protein [Rhodovulum kholense]|nr:hypothetical protein [Rhodovulum kholense]